MPCAHSFSTLCQVGQQPAVVQPAVVQALDWTTRIADALSDMRNASAENVLSTFVDSPSGTAVRHIHSPPVLFNMDGYDDAYNVLERRGIVIVDLPTDSRLDIFRQEGKATILSWLFTLQRNRWKSVFSRYQRVWRDVDDPTGRNSREYWLKLTAEPNLRKQLTILESELTSEGTTPSEVYAGLEALVELILRNPLVMHCRDVLLCLHCMLTPLLGQPDSVAVEILQTLLGCEDQMVHYDEFAVPIHRRRLLAPTLLA